MFIEEHLFLIFSLQIKSELCIFKKRYPVLPDRDLTNPYENVTLNKLSAGRLLPVYSAGLVQRLLVAHAARHTRGKSRISLIHELGIRFNFPRIAIQSQLMKTSDLDPSN